MRYLGPGLDLNDSKLLNVTAGVAADDAANVSQLGAGGGDLTVDGGAASSTYAGGGDILVDGGTA